MDERYEIERLITVGVFASSWEARLAQSRLEAEGIEAVVADEHTGHLYGGNAVGGVKLRVREEEAGQAGELLRTRRPIPEIYLVTEEDARQPRCPTCRSDNISFERWSLLGLLGTWLLLGIAVPVPRRRWSCRGCGAEWKEESEGETPETPEELTLVTVGRFHSPWEAHLARTLLESEGIEACVLEERLPALNLLAGEQPAPHRLEVHSGDAGRAVELLAEIEEVEEPSEGTASD